MKSSCSFGALIVCLLTLNLFSINAYAVAVSGLGTWETTLQPRDLDGNTSTIEAYYDTVLEITWLADANYANTAPGSPYTFGETTWAEASNWLTGLDLDGVSGPDGWRLPGISPVDGTTADDGIYSNIGTEDRGYNISAPGTLYNGSTASELAYLYYNTLGNLGFCDPGTSTASSCTTQPGAGLYNTGPFSNIQTGDWYWSSADYAVDPNYALAFDLNFGEQNAVLKGWDTGYAWAVHDDDIGAAIVPVPAAVWLFGSGLMGLIGVSRRNKAA